MTVDQLRALLEPYGIRPVKDRGQNFLLDGRVVTAMTEAADIGPGTHVVEIGPGPGILTAELLDRGAEVVAVELDSKLRALLRGRFAMDVRFRMCEGNALAFTNEQFLDAFEQAPSSYKVVANLPYAITTDILRKFLVEEPLPTSITVMVQREVADRLLAGPGDMSSFAVFVQTLGTARRIVNVPASAFFPAPKVRSAVIHIERKDERELSTFFRGTTADRYFSIVRTAFAGKRKQLKNTLKGLGIPENGLTKAFAKAKIGPDQRPEELSVQDWRRLALALTQ